MAKDWNIGRYTNISVFLIVDTDIGGITPYIPLYRRYIPDKCDHYYKKWKRRPENNDGLSENRRGL